MTNFSTKVFLVNEHVRAIVGVYEAEVNGIVPGTNKPAPRTTYKTLDRTIRVGDLVIVPSGTRHGFTTMKVVETDVDVDFDSHVEMKWVAARFDPSDYDKILREEDELLSVIKSAERRKKKDELRKALIVDQEALKTLAISTAGEEPPVT